MQQRQHPSQHPLRGTVHFNPGDTSVDTSCTNVQDEADLSEPREVRTIFGEIGRGTQDPAGAPVPGEEPEFMEFEDIDDRVEYRYSDEPEAPEDAMGKRHRAIFLSRKSLKRSFYIYSQDYDP